MNNLFLSSDISFSSADAGVVFLLWVLVVVGILLVIAMIFATVTKVIVLATYRKYNKIECQKKISAFDLTWKNLEYCKLPNVLVKKASWLRSLLGLNVQSFGNSYSAYKKTIYLRKNIIDKASITAVAVSTQKVGHAVMDDKRENQFYYRVKPLMFLAPFLMIPLMLLGMIIDLVVLQGLGIFTLVFAVVSLILFAFSFILLLITIPVEKRANNHAINILTQTEFATEEELVGIKKVYKAYILSYVADFIYAIVQVIWSIVRIALNSALKKKIGK